MYDTGPTALLPFLRKSYSGFLRSEKNPSILAGFEPANLGSSGEYDNHGTDNFLSLHFFAILCLCILYLLADSTLLVRCVIYATQELVDRSYTLAEKLFPSRENSYVQAVNRTRICNGWTGIYYHSDTNVRKGKY